MQEFKQYQRKELSEMIPFEDFIGQDMSKISISEPDKLLSNDEFRLGYIARNPKNHEDKWYVAKKYFEENFELYSEDAKVNGSKTLHNSNASGASVNVKDIIFWGDGDTIKLISKASSKNEGWMKSTKAMQIDGIGCVVQVTTQQGDNVAEALAFVPLAKINETLDAEGKVVSRSITHSGISN